MQLLVSRTGRMLLLATEEGRLSVRVDGRQMGPGREGIYWPSFSADGNGYTFAAGGDSSSAVVVDGTEGPTFDKVVTPRFTPDGTRVVYRARQHGERFVVVADRRARTLREHPHYQAVFDVTFSADGKSVGYGVRKGQELWWRVEPL